MILHILQLIQVFNDPYCYIISHMRNYIYINYIQKDIQEIKYLCINKYIYASYIKFYLLMLGQ